MRGNDNILSLFDSMWAISPSAWYEYMPFFANIISGNAPKTERDVNANINFVVAEDGQKISSMDTNMPSNSVGVVNLVGPMIRYGNYYMWGADELVAMLDYFEANPNIIGIILNIDSGGGSVRAVAPFMDFFKRKTKPVVSLSDTAASAALWVQSGTDYRMASNNISSEFGSIGVMANFLTYQKYMEEMGIKEHTIYSTYSDEKNKAFDLAMEGKYDLIKKEHLDPLAIKFQNDIKANLPKLDLNVPGIITGKMFYADEALKHGFIQEIGNMERAVKVVKELAAVQTFNINY